MVTQKQRRALVRPLIERRPDLAFHRQYVFFRDIRHYLRGAFLGSGGYGGLNLEAFVFPLVRGSKYPYFGGPHPFGLTRDQIPFVKYYYPGKSEPDLNSEALALEVSDLIEREALPQVEGIVSPAGLADRPGFAFRFFDEILGACFEGDFDRAERLVVAYAAREKERQGSWIILSEQRGDPPEYEPCGIALATEGHRFHDSNEWRIAYLGKLLQSDRSRIPALLHEWEEYTVNNFKLNKYWVRTPFPCDG